ncbi:DUF2182 domain-containing protein [Methylomarinum vadi]|uniref:DUF2182 domain-containing protein n=1 Tax=Methylomarinum vadi TaxID=438855 RepID=UPI000569CA3D|nr:DUF2182 domain-containing protein [Methylomarinum vadi]
MQAIIALLIAITLGAWDILYFQHVQMSTQLMAEMWMPPAQTWQWSFEDFTVVYTMWAVMMTAMMLPTALPMIKAYDKASRRYHANSFSYSLLFTLGYLLIWLVFSTTLTLLQWQLHGLHWLTPMMENNNQWLAALIFISAGTYQFSALKNSCLHHCRSPVSFLLNHWHPGHRGSIRMGLLHGTHCLGCCWAQMLLMFAVGVMNLSGMILLTLFMLLEKNSPPKAQIIGKTAGVLLCFWGIRVLMV